MPRVMILSLEDYAVPLDARFCVSHLQAKHSSTALLQEAEPVPAFEHGLLLPKAPPQHCKPRLFPVSPGSLDLQSPSHLAIHPHIPPSLCRTIDERSGPSAC